MATYSLRGSELIDDLAIKLLGPQYTLALTEDYLGMPPIPVGYTFNNKLSSWQDEVRRALLSSSIDPNFIGVRLLHLHQIIRNSDYADHLPKRTVYVESLSPVLFNIEASIVVTVLNAGAQSNIRVLGERTGSAGGRRLAWSLRVSSKTGTTDNPFITDLDTGATIEGLVSGTISGTNMTIPLFDTGYTLQVIRYNDMTGLVSGVASWNVDIQRPYNGNVINILNDIQNAHIDEAALFRNSPELYLVYKDDNLVPNKIAAVTLAYWNSIDG